MIERVCRIARPPLPAASPWSVEDIIGGRVAKGDRRTVWDFGSLYGDGERAGGEVGSRGGLAVMAAHKQRKFPRRGRSSAPESGQTNSTPIRATAPLVELYYVAVDRQLKSGFETYEAAEKTAKEIKKRYPNPQVTVFDTKKRSHTPIE